MFIEQIKINEIRHLKDIEINIGSEKKHLLITGKNGSGKTTILNELNLYMINVQNKKVIEFEKFKKHLIMYEERIMEKEKLLNRSLSVEAEYQTDLRQADFYRNQLANSNKINVKFNDLSQIFESINNSDFFIDYFEAKRILKIEKSLGVQKINLNELRKNKKLNQSLFLKYMVHLKTQLAYAIADNDNEEIIKYQDWFNRLESLLKEIFENNKLELIYDRNNYNFILKEGLKKFDFDTLSDGFSAIIDILTGIIIGMQNEEFLMSSYDLSGIVLIDELETHLHIGLQKKIFKVLNEFFPNIQFIMATHSPFILNSVKNCVIYDLETREEIVDLTPFSYDVIIEGYFNQDRYNETTQAKLNQFQSLAFKERTLDEEETFQNLKKEIEKVTSKDQFINKLEVKEKCLV